MLGVWRHNLDITLDGDTQQEHRPFLIVHGIYVEPRQIIVLRDAFEGLALVTSHVSAAPDCGSLKQDTRREESSPRSGDEVRGATRMKAGHYLDNRRPLSHHLRV
jgi:hypothetical protein